MSLKNGEFNWTDKITLEKYFDKLMEILTSVNQDKFKEIEDKMELRFKMSQIALDKAEAATNTRLENMNEFRNSLSDQTKTYMTRDLYESRHAALQNQVDNLRLSEANLAGKASQTSFLIALAVSIVSFLISMFDFIKGI